MTSEVQIEVRPAFYGVQPTEHWRCIVTTKRGRVYESVKASNAAPSFDEVLKSWQERRHDGKTWLPYTR